jgi:nitroreductase
MNILDIIKSRRSVRCFTDRKIPEDAVDILVDALRWAPSAGNLQSRKFYFVFNEDVRKRLGQAELKQDLAGFVAHAPLVVVACADLSTASRYGERGKSLYSIQDTAASIQNLLLTAHSLGFGTCWVGAFKEERIRSILNLPEHMRPVAIIPVGYPAQTPRPTDRVPKTSAVEIIH